MTLIKKEGKKVEMIRNGLRKFFFLKKERKKEKKDRIIIISISICIQMKFEKCFYRFVPPSYGRCQQ